jgi:uncharacterized membrane protein YhdT
MTSITIPDRAWVVGICEEFNAVVERRFWLFATIFVVVFLACTLREDVRNKMWLDEIFTLHMAQQANPGEIVRATLEGCDGVPPLYSMLIHAILPVVRNDALAVRLPSTLGYCGMVVCLLAFCRRRLPATYAFGAALLACNAALAYATEGRPYGLMLGFAAGALLCWQAAADQRRRNLAIPLLAVCFALMTAVHYFALFLLVPLFLAEMVRWRTSGRLDLAVLAAMVPVLIVLGVHYPLIAASKPFQQHFWSRASWHNVREVYPLYVKMCLPLVLLVIPWVVPQPGASARPGNLTMPEWVAFAAIALMPLAVIALSIHTTHVFVPRYTIWAVTGVAVLVAALLCGAARGASAVGVSTLALLVAFLAMQEAAMLRKKPGLRGGQAVLEELNSHPGGSEPIVVSNYHVFMELSYYGNLGIRRRLTYALSRDLDLRYRDVDTGARLMSALRNRSKLHIIDYDALLAAHPHFVLAAIPGDYLPWHLVSTGYRVVPIGSADVPVIFDVDAPGR